VGAGVAEGRSIPRIESSKVVRHEREGECRPLHVFRGSSIDHCFSSSIGVIGWHDLLEKPAEKTFL